MSTSPAIDSSFFKRQTKNSSQRWVGQKFHSDDSLTRWHIHSQLTADFELLGRTHIQNMWRVRVSLKPLDDYSKEFLTFLDRVAKNRGVKETRGRNCFSNHNLLFQ